MTPLEVTPEHPIYSIDRNDFVHAGSLSIGEQVKTRQGITSLEQRKQLAGTHRVYNLEVYRDHNFMVSMDSILVHNSKIEIDQNRVGHIFRNKKGHLVENTTRNQNILKSVTNNRSNILDTDRHGKQWAAKTNANGTQTWVQIRSGKIINGGINKTPKAYNSVTGLDNPVKPSQK